MRRSLPQVGAAVNMEAGARVVQTPPHRCKCRLSRLAPFSKNHRTDGQYKRPARRPAFEQDQRARTVGRPARRHSRRCAGDVIVQLDTTDLEANVRQDQAQVLSAQAQVAQAQQNYEIQVTQAKQNVLDAQAAVAAAQQNYLKLLRAATVHSRSWRRRANSSAPTRRRPTPSRR